MKRMHRVLAAATTLAVVAAPAAAGAAPERADTDFAGDPDEAVDAFLDRAFCG